MNATSDLQTRVGAARKNAVTLDVAHVDSTLLSPIPIPPENIDTHAAAYHGHSDDATAIGALLDLIESEHPKPNEHGGALRWKLTFRDAAGNAVLEVWHHNFERYGRIAQTQVEFDDDQILQYLHDHFDARP